jgi:WD repeat-containing protein 23
LHPVPAAQLFELLASSGLQHILRSNGWSTNIVGDDGDDESDDDFDASFIRRPRPRRTGGADNFPKVPSDEGTELMGAGQFGTNPYYVDRLKKRKGVFAKNLMWRELGIESRGLRNRASQSLSQVK